MAAVTPQTSQLAYPNQKFNKILWETITNSNNVGTGVKCPVGADKTVQAVGNFSGTAVVGIQGSNDSTNGTDGTWEDLEDPGGTAIALNVAGETETILENPIWIRPKIASGGDGSTDIDVIVLARRI